MPKEDLTEQEIALKLEKMRTDAIIDLHEWNSTKGEGMILNANGSLYSYKWFFGFNDKSNSFGMRTSLEKINDCIDCNRIKNYLEEEIGIFDIEYDTNFQENGGYDIIIKFDEKSKYSNNIKLYKRLLSKLKELKEES